ncbi:diguanylate cyclase [bacterium]|nr:diguanylate cyclase [bacterium]
MADVRHMRRILRQLPMDRLASSSRELVARALRDGVDDDLGRVARLAFDELIAAGDLVRVAVEGGARRNRGLWLVQGTSKLIDAAGLPDRGDEASGESAPDAVAPEPPRVVGAPRELDVGDMLDAMERAQDLAVGDPRADDPWVMVGRILGLLEHYLPDMSLHAQLNVVVGEPRSCGRLLPQPDLDGMPFWLRHRRGGQSLWVPDPLELPRELRHRLEMARLAEPVTAVVPIMSPLEAEGEIGLLYVSAGSTWAAADLLPLARRLSAFVSRRWRCQHDVNQRVLTDSLTGIPNRAFFDTQFPLELERVRRGEQPLTLVIGDLDHFKTVNDSFGHQCGDMVLRTVARQLQASLRRIDVVCRIGGEEFAFILPSTSWQEARDVLARMTAHPFRVALPPEVGVGMLNVTMSYGVVTFPDAGTSTGELHRKADSLLYRAKELGRRLCCIWTPDGIIDLRLPESSA